MKSIKPLFLLTFILIFLNSIVSAQDTDRGKTQWVDSIMSSLSLKEKIGQLMLVRANQPGKNYDPNIIKYIKDYDIGGVTFFKGGPVEQLKTTNEYQSAAKTPMLISIDAEWGLGMRLDSTISFPLQMTLGAISDNHLIEEMGLEIAKECKRMGIQFNFAPVVDINSNPKNPVIGMRSFGEDRDNVAAKGVAYMEGLQSENIISTAKHFPGHGDTDIDSHKSLPTITHDSLRMDSLELYPFKHLFNHNLSGIMIAHLYVPTYEKENNLPTTLSNNVVTKLLKEQLGFKGLVVTDGLDMQGVAKYFPAGEIEVRALEAGNDILLLPQNVPVAVQSIEKAIKEGRLSEDLINDRCRKVLSYKYDAGLNELTLQSTDNLYQDLNNSKALALRKKLFEHAITLVKNDSDLIPLKNLDDISIASISIGKNNNSFQRMLDRYSGVEKLYLPKVSNESQQKQVLRKAKKADVIIIDVQNTNINARDNFGVSKETIAFINQLRKDTKAKIILDVFAAPYVLSDINPDHFDAILMSYQEKVDAQLASAQIIFGGLPALGHLPVNVSESFKLGQGIETKKIRIAYEASNSTVLHPEYLAKVDSILLNGLKIKAYPGCQVMAMKDGAVIYNRNLGFHTANRKKAVRPDDIYDIASITKIAATTLAIMKLDKEGKIDIDRRLSDYLYYLKGTNKEDLIIREVLAHQAGLYPWIPFYKSTIKENGKLKRKIYRRRISNRFPTRVAEKMYLKKDYKHVMIDSIIASPVDTLKQFQYSDLGFILLPEVIEMVVNKPFEQYVYENFYKPLGLHHIEFNPREHTKLDNIIPTEKDTEFRKQLVHGDVHDPGAAMLGGVSGHAGLFSNANDLAIIMQMLLDKGSYGGIQLLDSAKVEEYTKTQFPLNDNRRGIGFDKPLLTYHDNGPNCRSASHKSFGHSGFTGTYSWADPENGLVYIFLSNRVYPNSDNKKLMKLDIRTNIHEAFYHAIGAAKEYHSENENSI